MSKQVALLVGLLAGFALVLSLVVSITIVPVGHVGVYTLFGDVRAEEMQPGFYLCNPLATIYDIDVRRKTHKEKVSIPCQDQLTVECDISIQWRVISASAAESLQDTGGVAELLEVHLVPTLRSKAREEGKSIERSELLFQETTQTALQGAVLTGLQERMQPVGIEVSEVLLRNIRLPEFITEAVQRKKEREQKAEEQKAELERFRTEQEQTVAKAEADLKAAEAEAAQKKLLADAQAYEIDKINTAIAGNPAYVQLKALEALQSISKDPASKVYFLNGDSPQPLPLLNLGVNREKDSH